MPKPVKGPRLGGSPAHQKHIIRNLAKELIKHGKIQTTVKKAKTVQPEVERLVKYAKKGDLHNIRLINKFLNDKDLTRHMVAEVGPKNADRAGGATRVLKIGPRKSDQAPMAIITWTDPVAPFIVKEEEAAPAVKAGRTWGRRKSAETAEETTKVVEAPKRSVDDDAASVTPEEVEARLDASEADVDDAAEDAAEDADKADEDK